MRSRDTSAETRTQTRKLPCTEKQVRVLGLECCFDSTTQRRDGLISRRYPGGLEALEHGQASRSRFVPTDLHGYLLIPIAANVSFLVRVCACVRGCVRACVRVCARVCVRAPCTTTCLPFASPLAPSRSYGPPQPVHHCLLRIRTSPLRDRDAMCGALGAQEASVRMCAHARVALADDGDDAGDDAGDGDDVKKHSTKIT